MDRQEWLEARKSGIGGSDAAAIIGLNPYKTNIQLWEEKTGQCEPEDISYKDFVKYGTEAEEHLRKLFMLDHPEYTVLHEEYQIEKHKDYPFLLASLDGTLIEKESQRKGILEIKTTNILQSMQKEKWSHQIPDNYYVQVLHYLLVTGYDFAILKAQLKSSYGNEIYLQTKHYRIERAEVEDDLAFLQTEEIKFWNLVQTNTRPNLKLPPL